MTAPIRRIMSACTGTAEIDFERSLMKILVTGAKGQLGHDVLKALATRGIVGIPADLEEFDITDEHAVMSFISACRPDAIVHCAAYTAVDRAEEESELCRLINVAGSEHIARACREVDAKLVYISTDYVFPGTGGTFYETDSPTGPLSVYGRAKLAGELAVKQATDKYFIVRTSWVFGKSGNNFVKTMLRLGKERREINVVMDQIGSPTYSADLAPLLCDMLATEQYGVYHATNEGLCSWADFARAIFRLAGYDVVVNPVTTAQYGAKAHRPLNSRLSKGSLDAAGFKRLPVWEDALERYLKELGE